MPEQMAEQIVHAATSDCRRHDVFYTAVMKRISTIINSTNIHWTENVNFMPLNALIIANYLHGVVAPKSLIQVNLSPEA